MHLLTYLPLSKHSTPASITLGSALELADPPLILVPTLGKRKVVKLYVEKLLKSQVRRKTCYDNRMRIAASTEIGVMGYYEKYTGDAFNPIIR